MRPHSLFFVVSQPGSTARTARTAVGLLPYANAVEITVPTAVVQDNY